MTARTIFAAAERAAIAETLRNDALSDIWTDAEECAESVTRAQLAIAQAAAMIETAPTVEVSAWYNDSDGTHVCNDQTHIAHGFGIYIRNPLAMHVVDFVGPRATPLVYENRFPTILDAQDAAFTWADALAEHLGITVESQVQRAPVASPSPPPVDPAKRATLDALQAIDFSPFPGLYDMIPWTSLEAEAADGTRAMLEARGYGFEGGGAGNVYMSRGFLYSPAQDARTGSALIVVSQEGGGDFATASDWLVGVYRGDITGELFLSLQHGGTLSLEQALDIAEATAPALARVEAGR